MANANDNVSDQMVAVAAVSLLRPEDVRERNAICAYLETTFRRHLKVRRSIHLSAISRAQYLYVSCRLNIAQILCFTLLLHSSQ